MYSIYYDSTNNQYGIRYSHKNIVCVYNESFVNVNIYKLSDLPSSFKLILDNCIDLHNVLNVRYYYPDMRVHNGSYKYVLYKYRGFYYLCDWDKAVCYEVSIIDNKVMLTIINNNIGMSWVNHWTFVSGGNVLLDCFKQEIVGFKTPKEILLGYET